MGVNSIMLLYFQKLVDHTYLTLLKAFGDNRAIAKHEVAVKLNTLNVVTVYGYDISIYCKKTQYHYQQHSMSSMACSGRHIFRVHGECSPNTPEHIKKVITSRIYLPRLVPHYVSDDLNARFIIEAYLDIITGKMEEYNNSKQH